MGDLPLGQRILTARLAKGLTQTELARQLGVGQGLLASWEAGSRLPSTDRLEALAHVLGLDDLPERRGPVRLDQDFVEHYAGLYEANFDLDRELRLFEAVGPEVKARGHYTKPEFLDVAVWKSPRPTKRFSANTEESIRHITEIALARQTSERASVLTELNGVRLPIASALLAVWDPRHYTIMDVRAVETLVEVGELPRHSVSYGYYLWKCRQMAARIDGDDDWMLRKLDRALWMYSRLRGRG